MSNVIFCKSKCITFRDSILALLIALQCFWTASCLAKDPLQILIQDAITSHPSIRGQKFLLQSSESGVEAAQWQFYPTPSVSAEQGRFDASDPSYQGDDRVVTLRLQQPLWTGGRLTAGLDKARANVDATKGSVNEVGQTLAISVIDACGELSGGELRVKAYQQSLQVHQMLLERVTRRVNEGASPQSDLTLAKSRLSGTEADLASAIAIKRLAFERLRELIGRPIESMQICNVKNNFPVMTATAPETLVRQAIDISPSLTKLKFQAEAAKQDIALVKSDMSPEVYLRLERQYGNFNIPGYGGTGLNRVFVGVSTRFGAGFSTVALINAASAKYESSLTDIDAKRRQLSESVRSEIAKGLSAQERRVMLDSSVKNSELVAQSWGRQFLAGRKQWQDVMNAAREHSQIQVQHAEAIASSWMSNWRLVVLTEGVESVLRKNLTQQKAIK